jgi:ppGpp synthetase/RelA/SpoT-type nucleotidyltranferase
MSIAEEYKLLEPSYSSFTKEVIEFLNALRAKHAGSVDSYNVDGRVKEFKSIEDKIAQSKGKYKQVIDLQDVAGTRVIFLCTSDLDRFDTILQEELKKTYPGFTREVIAHDSGYRGIHFIISKKFEVDGKEARLYCEIQVRTVLQDAWAILSHQYGYKKKTEGDSDILKQVVSGILDNCENLWELVKKSTKGGEEISDMEASMIYQDTTTGIESAQKAISLGDMDGLISGNKTAQVEEFLEEEVIKIKAAWVELSQKSSTGQSARQDALAMLTLWNAKLRLFLLLVFYQ